MESTSIEKKKLEDWLYHIKKSGFSQSPLELRLFLLDLGSIKPKPELLPLVSDIGGIVWNITGVEKWASHYDDWASKLFEEWLDLSQKIRDEELHKMYTQDEQVNKPDVSHKVTDMSQEVTDVSQEVTDVSQEADVSQDVTKFVKK